MKITKDITPSEFSQEYDRRVQSHFGDTKPFNIADVFTYKELYTALTSFERWNDSELTKHQLSMIGEMCEGLITHDDRATVKTFQKEYKISENEAKESVVNCYKAKYQNKVRESI